MDHWVDNGSFKQPGVSPVSAEASGNGPTLNVERMEQLKGSAGEYVQEDNDAYEIRALPAQRFTAIHVTLRRLTPRNVALVFD
ncbi:hypothetical protein OI25_3018 [Paraburkholderia fungorum]|uniref:Uncharacterized protein n=1 Tax=Paraburkholderia fungorum TaxID=134537 RepID=A0AAU8T7M7_9BURK|nr:hypothetical protein OI25_3018 [Paraburkholderia fungorum]